MLRTYLILGLISAFCLEMRGQAPMYGLPGIRNFTRSEFAGGIQSWSFTQAENGLLYFANNSGLLEYNGNTWTLYQSIKAVNRAVCADGNRIYTGAYNEFGYYEENERGNLLYHSLTYLTHGKTGDFDEIWRIHKTDFGIVFQSFKALFIYRDGKMQVVEPPSVFHLSYYVNGFLWLYDEAHGLMKYRDGQLTDVPGGDFFKGTNIWTILPLNTREILIGTSMKGVYRYDGSGLYPWESPVNERLKQDQIYSAIRLKNNYFAFGTVQNGILVTDTTGHLVFEMNKQRGLQNNTVLGIGQDYRGNIWLCLDNGISMIEFDSPVSYFQHYFDIGTGYASAKFRDNIYLGTNQGLFYIRWSDFIDPSKAKNIFRLIEGTEGQVWNLSVIDNTLLCGHNNGIFQVEGSRATRVSALSGAWNFLKINQKNLVLAGSYSGLAVLENQGGQWKLRNKLEGFDESSRFVQLDQSGAIWVSQTYKGIFRLKCDSGWEHVVEAKLFDSRSGLPSDQSNSLFRIQSELLVATEKGIRTFIDKTQLFENDLKFAPFFDQGMRINYLYQDSASNVWFYAGNQLGVLRIQEDGSYKKITVPFAKLDNVTIPAFEHVYEIDRNNVLIGIEGGFANYISKYNKDYSLPCTAFISDLRSRDTTEGIYRYNSRYNGQKAIPAFRYKNNTVSITFASNNFESVDRAYQHRLMGFDDNWSDWTEKNFKEYTNLPAGKYTFLLRAYNNDQAAPSETAFKFVVSAPWYASTAAWIAYALLFILMIFFGQRYLSYRIEKSRLAEKQKQKEKYLAREQKLKEEALVAEKEMERLRNEALRLEMIHKEKEMANSTMLLIKKNNILQKLQSDLRGIGSSLGNDPAKNSISSLIRRIDREIDNENQWKVFNTHIEQIYEELFKKLKESYPDLTPRELSLCAYLRMNISSKEIATLMNISARGVEISRYRIRKKLRLDRDDNLTEFMLNL